MRDIFLIDLRGTRFGVWKDEILSVKDIAALHLIPFSPARIAGIMMVDGQTVTLADLAVCLGYEAAPTLGQGGIFIMGTDKNLTGFVVDGQIDAQSISTELILPIPDYLKTPLFDSCVVHDNRTIPLIKISALYTRAMQGDVEFVAGEPVKFAAQAEDVSSIAKIRFFSVGGEVFAASATGIDESAVRPVSITRLPNTPEYVSGVTFREGCLLPVVDLALRINLESTPPHAPMLIAQLAGSTFGLLVAVDGLTLPVEQVTIKPLPKITQTAWMKNAVLRTGEIIPLVDFAMALSPASPDEITNRGSYTPSSGFSEKFFKQDVEVVEFSLLGERHALPKDEVEHIIAYQPCRALPDEPNIVIGVAEHNGEILPVLDLAMMYGRCSITTPDWRMIVLKNGDFRALVLTETVYAERKLKVDIHRTVPIHLPNHLLYGCYPDGNAARIILNIEAIAERLEKSLIQKFLPALSPEMKMLSMEVGKAGGDALKDVNATTPEAQAAQGEEAVEKHAAATELLIADGERDDDKSAHVQDTLAEAEASMAPEAEAIAGSASGTESHTKEHLILSVKDEADEAEKMQRFTRSLQVLDDAFAEWKKDDTTVQGKERGSNSTPINSPPYTAVNPIPTTGDAGRDAEAAASAHADQTAEKNNSAAPEQETAPPVSSIAQKVIAPATIAVSTSPPASMTTPLLAAQQNKAAKAAVANKPPEQSINVVTQPVASPANRLPVKQIPPAEITARYPISPQAEPRAVLRDPKGSQVSSRRSIIFYAAVATVLLAALFYYAGNSDEKSHMASSDASAVKQEQALPAAPTITKNPPVQLELVIPKSRPPVDVAVYRVVQGDTLWDISERFTGDPFNYPRIAGENKVANPDMIFPGQQIRLIK